MRNISIVTPVFNGAKTIAETIASVQAQGPFVHEHIIIDALSTDETRAVVASLADERTHLHSERDNGLYDGMNKGIDKASGDIIGIINADDFLNDGALQRVSDAFADQSIDYVYSDLLVVDEHGNFVRNEPPKLDWIQGKKSLLGRDWRMINAISHPTLFVRKRVYNAVGKFDTTFKIAADHEFVARLISMKKKGFYIEGTPLASFRLGGVSNTKVVECLQEDKQIALRYGVPSVLAKLLFWRKSRWHIANR